MPSQGDNKCTSPLTIYALLLFAAGVVGLPTFVEAAGLSGLYNVLTERTTVNQAAFYLYEDADSGFNHGFPSGFFASTDNNLQTIHIDAACIDDPASITGCSSNPDILDRTRGNVLRISFDPQTQGNFAGVNFEEPENWGASQTGRGYDLTGATELVFDVRSPSTGGLSVRFGIAGKTTSFITLPQSSAFTTQRIPLSSLGISPNELANVNILFTVVTNDVHAPAGGALLLDNIRFEPVPTSQRSALSFPLSNRTFGVIALDDKAIGAYPFPPDQVNRNLTTIYESALALLALLDRGTVADLSNARLLADAFDYALRHDNHGDPLPTAADGSSGLHSAYISGDLALFNGQGAGSGQQGEIRLAGFSVGSNLCGPSHFCLFLDGATGGNNAFAILALVSAYKQFGDSRYLDDAKTIGRWIVANLTDGTNTGFGGYYLGYPDEGAVPKFVITAKSVENNADIFAAFSALAMIEKGLGNTGEADFWTAHANIAGDFVMQLYDSSRGCFFAGTVPLGTPASPGIQPNGSVKGDEIVNTSDFFDSNSFTSLALAGSSRYGSMIDWRMPVECILNGFAQSISVANESFQGFNIVKASTTGPNGIAWEFTGQAIALMKNVDRLYPDPRFGSQSTGYLSQLLKAQSMAPFGDGQGLVASTLQDGDRLPPLAQCLATPFQCIPERVGLAATAWGIFAIQDGNPLNPLRQPNRPPIANVGPDQTAFVGATVTLDGSTSIDPDNGPAPLSYQWTQASGPSVILAGPTTATPSFTPIQDGTYRFSLVVNDGAMSSAPAVVTITIIQPPDATPIQVLSPNGGEVWKARTTQTIRWRVSNTIAESGKRLIVSFSKNGGRTWRKLKKVQPAEELLQWTPKPAQQTTQGLIRICRPPVRGNGSAVCDVSDGTFTINLDTHA